jgi:hypothetical protein
LLVTSYPADFDDKAVVDVDDIVVVVCDIGRLRDLDQEWDQY